MMDKLSVYYTGNLYPLWAIDNAREDYSDICKIVIEEAPSGTSCTFYDSIAPLDLTAAEFSNYIIEMVNSRRNDSM